MLKRIVDLLHEVLKTMHDLISSRAVPFIGIGERQAMKLGDLSGELQINMRLIAGRDEIAQIAVVVRENGIGDQNDRDDDDGGRDEAGIDPMLQCDMIDQVLNHGVNFRTERIRSIS